jgi:predicted nucleic acid-binding protein
MEQAFWDTSALLPLCVPNQTSRHTQQLARRYAVVVWWATHVEMRSALARELRTGKLTGKEHTTARDNLVMLERKWQQIQPSDPLRSLAGDLLERYPLSAADALQLAAAYTWCDQRPFSRCFICGDKRLLGAARSAGFHAISIS